MNSLTLNISQMYNLKLHNQAVTLVDQVEDSLLNYFREHEK